MLVKTDADAKKVRPILERVAKAKSAPAKAKSRRRGVENAQELVTPAVDDAA